MIEVNAILSNRDSLIDEMILTVNGIGDVRDYAILKHAGQRYGDKPYVFHLDDVSLIAYAAMRQANVDHDVMLSTLSATYAHDILEDTDTTEVELQKVIGSSVVAVKYATKDPSHKRPEALKALIAKTHALDVSGSLEDLIGLIVKMSDGLANRTRSATGSEMASEKLQSTYRAELALLFPAYESLQERNFIHPQLKNTYNSLLISLSSFL